MYEVLPFTSRTDGRFGAVEAGIDSVADNEASRSGRLSGSSATRLGRIRPFGAETSTGGWAAFFAPIAAASAGCDSRSNAAGGLFVSSDCTVGLEAAASLGRRRTSTVNDGTMRLNVALDSCRRRPSEAVRCGGEPPVVSAELMAGMRQAEPSMAQPLFASNRSCADGQIPGRPPQLPMEFISS